jgi:hypothetical protein
MSLGPHEAGIRLAVGVSGAGKTHGARSSVIAAARAGTPVIVVDRMREWNQTPADLHDRTRGATSIAEAAKAVNDGAAIVVVRTSNDVRASIDACAWARDHERLVGVCLPEAHRIAPNAGALPTAVEDVACAWRHYKVALWLDTQRLPLLNRTLTENAREVRLYAVTGDVDFARVRELGGRELERAVRECAARLARGEAGWHVRLGLVRVPPYVLARDA